ncbi:beta-glucosidase [Caldifermentibacillus hisashii]|uniref:beta-glucosidase n=1 Tax=Caldifermentibacillus hisashii TaxID=996558 RepID=UPI002E0457CF|nr:glycoside hydrolase family 3 C-terminal domain-containing protein [Caldifermentibacillus hisashii]MEC5271724.1 glycoside hydrolase family 3 C-terminal domain-containing protein [Caldifermentibacillus hisashii]
MKVDKKYRLTYTTRAKELVDKMSLEEKVYLMSGRVSMEEMLNDFKERHYNWRPYPASGNERLGVPEIKFVDGPRGVVSGNSTCFPVAMSRGATFDKKLEERVGNAIAKEIRAHGGNLFGGVCINLPYNPGWGRSQEVYGEDSFLLGAMGSALVKGVQEENVIACVKHYAFNSMENVRFNVNVTADKRTEREVYLQHFKDCIDAGAASVMAAYNLYQGTQCGHSDYLLNHVLKEEWDFDGFVISDFVWGVKDTVEAANGGMDIEMPHTKFYGEKLIEAVKEGKVSEEKIDEAALRIVRTLLAFTEADDKEYSKDLIASEEHISLALEAAEKSMTLMKNDNNVLPFSKSETKRIAVIGDLGNKGNIGDHGSSRVLPPYIVTPLEGIKKLLPESEVIFESGDDLEKAKSVAESADAVVFVVGYDHDDEGEWITNEDTDLKVGGDRKNGLGLHDKDIELIKAVGPVNDNSAVVLIGGNMIMIEEWKQSVSSILMAYYPGMEGGTAIAKTLFGDVNPGGKLPFVVPVNESDLPQVDWDATEITYDYYHGYAKLDKEGIQPSLPFGYGLSYTDFEISNASFTVQDDQIVASCDVENVGNRSGAEVVQMYVGFSKSNIDRPKKLLRGFERIELNPGQKERVEIACPIEKIKWFNPEKNQWELEDIEYEVYIGNSSAEKDLLSGNISLEGNPV